MKLPLADIYPNRDAMRSVNKASVETLAASMERLGLRSPITVRPVPRVVNGASGFGYEIVAGRHRFEAARKLGWEEIDAAVIEDAATARLWEIAENLHRSDLTPVERAEHIEEWRKLTGERVTNISSPSGGRQPAEAGIRKTARDLGVPQKAVQNAAAIASLPDDVKQQAREERWPATRLLEAARPPRAPVIAPEARNDLEAVEAQVSRLMSAWNAAGPEAREEFMRRVDVPAFDRAGG